jgi:hypothetical protein
MDQRQLPEDFKDFINILNSNDVRYLLVGGWAVVIYGYPRATKDIDISLVSKDDLIKNKKASVRNRDLADVDNLLGKDNEKKRGRCVQMIKS